MTVLRSSKSISCNSNLRFFVISHGWSIKKKQLELLLKKYVWLNIIYYMYHVCIYVCIYARKQILILSSMNSETSSFLIKITIAGHICFRNMNSHCCRVVKINWRRRRTRKKWKRHARGACQISLEGAIAKVSVHSKGEKITTKNE